MLTQCIIQPPGSNTTLALDRNGAVFAINSADMRKFLHRTKDTASLEKRFELRIDPQNQICLNTQNHPQAKEKAQPRADFADEQGIIFTFDALNIGMLDAVVLKGSDGIQRLLTCLVNRAGCFAVESRKLPPAL